MRQKEDPLETKKNICLHDTLFLLEFDFDFVNIKQLQDKETDYDEMEKWLATQEAENQVGKRRVEGIWEGDRV